MKWLLPLAVCVVVGAYLVSAGALDQSGCRDGGSIEMADEGAYQAEARVWRDEQPGDDPILHVSVQLMPTGNEPSWSGLDITCVEVKAGDEVWSPRETSIEMLGNDGFVVRGSGEPTLEAGTSAEVFVKFTTRNGDRSISAPVENIQIFE